MSKLFVVIHKAEKSLVFQIWISKVLWGKAIRSLCQYFCSYIFIMLSLIIEPVGDVAEL